MADSLRKRISKRIANANLKSGSSEREQTSPDPAPVSDVSAPGVISSSQNEDKIPLLDALNASPPPPSLKSRLTGSEEESSPQSLLDRYKNRRVPPKMAKTHATRTEGKYTSFSEDFGDEFSAVASDWVDVPRALEDGSDRDERMFDGVKFEMMGKKGQAAEAPKAPADDDVFMYERRRTRSQTRRSQRADSADSTDTDADAAKVRKNDDLLKPPGLTIKKVTDMESSRTPSPQSASEEDPSVAGPIAPTPSNSPSAAQALAQMQNTLLVDHTKRGAEYRLSNSPDPLAKADKPVYRGLRRKLPEPPAAEPQVIHPPTLVIPPLYSSNIQPGQVWVSALASSSRPELPWCWMKKWICCRCAHLDPHEQGRAAETMVEQKVCSRLTCQHVRCTKGCRVARDAQHSEREHRKMCMRWAAAYSPLDAPAPEPTPAPAMDQADKDINVIPWWYGLFPFASLD